MNKLPEAVQIPMRDGVALSGLLYRQGDEPQPALLQMTPYIADRYHPQAAQLATKGYAVLLVNVRGRAESDGRYDPFVQEADDAPDAIDWVHQQGWCDGSVAMWGGSYSGTNQWAATKAQHPALKAISPIAAAYLGRDFPARNGIFMTYLIRWLTVTGGKGGNWAQFADRDMWADIYTELYAGGHSFAALDELSGRSSEVFKRWLRKDWLQSAQAKLNPTAEDLVQLSMPVLTVTGHYDGDQPGAMEHYRKHLLNKPDADHWLVIGPWDHAATANPRPNIGGVEVGDESLIDIYELLGEWFDWRLKNKAKPEFLKKKVSWFVPGANRWRHADTLEEVCLTWRPFYLHGGTTTPLTTQTPGKLSNTSPEQDDVFSFVDDPADIEAMIARDRVQECHRDTNFAVWHDDVNAISRDGLVFDSSPLQEELELSGFPSLELSVAIDTPDTDLRARLYEVSQDGSTIKLSEDFLRFRYRNGLEHEELATPGTQYKVSFNNFMFFSRLLAPGSKIRLVIDNNNSLEWQQNYNGGQNLAEENASSAQTSTIRIFQSADQPCVLNLPLSNTAA